MRFSRTARWLLALLLLIAPFSSRAASDNSNAGFTSLFDGKTLNGWQVLDKAGEGYLVKDGIIVCPADGGGKLLTDREYSDFVFRFEFKLDAEGNNGVGIRAPLNGDAAYRGMEIQILDNDHPSYKNLLPSQYHGSIYKVVAAKRGALKPTGEWNSEEISAIGRRIKVTVNGKEIVNADLNTVRDPATLAEHPGILRDRGYIGFLGHGPSAVYFRNISVKDLSKPEQDNTPPPGFTALFNGKDLKGWKGLVADPPTRAKMTKDQLAAAQKQANQQMQDHWTAAGGFISYDGHGNSLCTMKDYADFELLVDWKIETAGDSGIYLRGSPQVQIWDCPNSGGCGDQAIGSGGLYNNQKNPSTPTHKADNPPGQWNRFRILMVGDKVTVFLNDELIVDNVTMENYWERDKPIYPTGQIELQHHGSHLEFKNIYIREIPRSSAK